jgi:Tol biopolymer transport system component
MKFFLFRLSTVLMIVSTFTLGLLAESDKRAFTIADLYDLKNVADPQISPDGKKIAFTVTTQNLTEGKSNSDIYLINPDGSELRRMTYSEQADFRPRWSPDGKYLLFVSTRKNGTQAWRIPIRGGEAEQLTDFSAGVNDPIWTSDGRRIIFYTDIWPECGADSDCNKKLADSISKGPVHAHLADDLLYRHWTHYHDGKRFHTLIYDIDSNSYTDLTPGDLNAPYYMTGGGNSGLAVSPDGKEICVSSNSDPNHLETTNKDLFLVSTSGGEMKKESDIRLEIEFSVFHIGSNHLSRL